VLADVKTIEACGGYGFGVCSSVTFQNDISFEGVQWLSAQQIINQIKPLQNRFELETIKIGLIEDIDTLQEICIYLKATSPKSKIIWDPILKASAGFVFHNNINKAQLDQVLVSIDLITPNWVEAIQLANTSEAIYAAKWLSSFCNVYLKGGHSKEERAIDRLFQIDKEIIEIETERLQTEGKHGSGCVLSSAIATYLALGFDLETACRKAKSYINKYLKSTDDLLGVHYRER
jgi:hydroxymethylpyrimidine/phosphomethylpyrimidine kinase